MDFNKILNSLDKETIFKEYVENKEKLFTWLFSVPDKTDAKDAVLHFISKHKLLPYGDYYGDSPECFDEKFWGNRDYKYAKVDFSWYCEGEENWDPTEEYFQFDRELTYSEFVDQVFEFVKEKRLIGTHFDW